MERQVRNQARLLFLVSGILLVACTSMTATFGWEMGNGNLFNALIGAVAFAAADVGGACLISLSSISAANKEDRAAKRWFILALLCMGMTFVGILGFQSENRETRAATREKSMQIVSGFVGWAESLVTSKEQATAKGKSKVPLPDTLENSVDTVGKQVMKQLEMLGKGEVAPSADGQAATLSRATGMSEANARSWVTIGTSAALLIIQYGLWSAYGFTRQKLELIVSTATGSQRGEMDGNFPEKVLGISKAEAKLDASRLIQNGVELSIGEYADRWGLSDGGASKWLTEFADEGAIRKVWKNGKKVAVAPRLKLVKPNGNGTTHVS